MLTLALALLIAAQADPDGELDAAPERAQDDRAAAAKLIGEGNVHLDAGRASEALRCFNEAYDLFASATIFVSMAEAHLKLGNDVRAAELYQRFLEEKSDGAAAKLVMLAEQRLEELVAELAQLEVKTPEEGALISIDDDPIGETPLPAQFMKPGSYRVGVTKDGFTSFSTTVELESGEQRALAVKLEALPPPPPPVMVKAPPPSKPPWGDDSTPPAEGGSVASTWWFWTAIGAAVAAGVTVGIVAGTSSGDPFVPGGELGLSGTSTWTKL